MSEILIKGVGKKININSNSIIVRKTIGKDLEIPLRAINDINYEKGTMNKNGFVNIEWINDSKMLKESVMFRCFSNDIVEEAVRGVLKYLEDPSMPLEINSKEKIGAFEQIIKEGKEQASVKLEEKTKVKDKLKEYDKEGIPYCPKCNSTSIQYVERRKKLSVGRALVGGALLGGTGAVLGGLTSKKIKGNLKCLKCGHEWKI